jgi:hypothetical protein
MASAMPESVKEEFVSATSPPIVETMAWFSALPEDVRTYVSSMNGALSSLADGKAAATDSPSDAKTTTGLGAGAGTATVSDSAYLSSQGSKTTKATTTPATTSGSKNGTQTKNAGLVAATPMGGNVGGIVVGVVGAVLGAAALL